MQASLSLSILPDNQIALSGHFSVCVTNSSTSGVKGRKGLSHCKTNDLCIKKTVTHAKYEGNRNRSFTLPKRRAILQVDAPKDTMLCMTTIENCISRIKGLSNLSEGTQFSPLDLYDVTTPSRKTLGHCLY